MVTRTLYIRIRRNKMSSFAPTSSGQSSTSDAAKFDAQGAEFFVGMYDELQNFHNALS